MNASSLEIPVIDHEAIRAVGETMALHIGELATQQVDRDTIIVALNTCADSVPYGAMFEEDARLAWELEETEGDTDIVDQTLADELRRLDGLVATFEKKLPSQADAAKERIAKKKVQAKRQAELQRAGAERPRKRLESEQAQLTATIDSVSAPWPLPLYSEEAKEAARSAAAALTEAENTPELDIPAQVDEFTEEHNENESQEAAEEEIILGPYAELAASIPSLNERLEHSASKHRHAYGDVETARQKLNEAVAIPETERTEQEDLLVKAVFVLRHRFLEKPNNIRFLQVYEPDDIIELAKRLHKFSTKNRPDFKGLEGRILDKAAARIPMRGGRQTPQDLQGAIDRMDEDTPGRTGMTWHSLTKYANRACDTMRNTFFAGGAKNTHLKDYVIDVADRSGAKPDISWIYQFVVDEFSFEILGRRETEQQASAKETFLKNSDIIDAWFAESKGLLEQIPEDFRLRRYNPRTSFRLRHRQAVYESSPAPATIKNTIKDLEIRRQGNAGAKARRHKPMRLDPQGAVNHQLRLGHIVDSLKRELATYDVPTEGHTEEISPLV